MRYETQTRLTADEVLDEAAEFFGPSGLGLAPVTRAPGLGEWRGGGGAVQISAVADEQRRATIVELTTREWDDQVRQFLGKIRGFT